MMYYCNKSGCNRLNTSKNIGQPRCYYCATILNHQCYADLQDSETTSFFSLLLLNRYRCIKNVSTHLHFHTQSHIPGSWTMSKCSGSMAWEIRWFKASSSVSALLPGSPPKWKWTRRDPPSSPSGYLFLGINCQIWMRSPPVSNLEPVVKRNCHIN